MGGKRRNLTEFKRLSVEKFGENVFKLDDFNYVDMKTKGTIVCSKGHTYQVSPAVHLRGDGGCKECANQKVGQQFADTQEEWIEKSKKMHGEKYGYEKSIYRGQKHKVVITCRRCLKDFEQNPTSHAHGCGCPTCGIEASRVAKILTDDEVRTMIESSSYTHRVPCAYVSRHDRDGRLFVLLECPKHGTFEQRLDHYLHGHSCVKCCSSVSRSELEWIAYLSVSYRDYSICTQYKIPTTKYTADAYCPELRRAFEYHGDFWHGNPAVFSMEENNPRTKTTYGHLYANTLAKHAAYEDLGHTVKFVWESDWNRAKRAVVALQRVFRSTRSK